jgi:hypothetical protein
MREQPDCDQLDLDTRDLAELLAQRLGAVAGTVRLNLIFRDGRWVDGYQVGESERLSPRELECRCRRHAWQPDCPRHGLPTDAAA